MRGAISILLAVAALCLLAQGCTSEADRTEPTLADAGPSAPSGHGKVTGESADTTGKPSESAKRTEPVPLDSLDLDVASLAEMPLRKYTMTRIDASTDPPSEERVGIMTLDVWTEEPHLVIENTARMFLPDGVRFLDTIGRCDCSRNALLSLVWGSVMVVRSDSRVVRSISVRITDGRAIATLGHGPTAKQAQADWPDKTVVEMALFYLVPLLSREPGKAYSVEALSPFPIDPKRTQPALITCQGPDQSAGEPGGRWTRFDVRKGQADPSPISYWVDSAGQVRRVQLNAENRLDLIEGDSSPLTRPRSRVGPDSQYQSPPKKDPNEEKEPPPKKGTLDNKKDASPADEDLGSAAVSEVTPS